MGWLFIIIGSLFVVFAFSCLLYLYVNNPLTKYRWKRRIKNFVEKRERRKTTRKLNQQLRTLKHQKKIREESKAIKQKEKEAQGLSERDINRIQQRGLRYIDEENR